VSECRNSVVVRSGNKPLLRVRSWAVVRIGCTVAKKRLLLSSHALCLLALKVLYGI